MAESTAPKIRGDAVDTVEHLEWQKVATAAANWSRPTPDRETKEFVRIHFGTLLTNSERVALPSARVAPFDPCSVTDYLPRLDSTHALRVAEPFGFRLHEPQASSGIVHFCSVDYPRGLKPRRCAAAVRSLLPNEPSQSPYIRSLQSAHDFDVASEERVSNSRERMDWVISWRDARGAAYRLVVEMKFDHTLTPNQLEAYGQDALRKVDDPNRLRLVLLTREGRFERTDRRRLKQVWHPLSWLNFLRRWEEALAEADDTDPTFTMFRRQLWARIGD